MSQSCGEKILEALSYAKMTIKELAVALQMNPRTAEQTVVRLNKINLVTPAEARRVGKRGKLTYVWRRT